MYFYSINNILGNGFYMGNGNFWQLFLGKEPYSKKSDFVKMDVKNAPAGPNLCRGIFYVRFFDSHQSNVSTTLRMEGSLVSTKSKAFCASRKG